MKRSGDKAHNSTEEDVPRKKEHSSSSRYEFEGSKFPKGQRSEREKRKLDSTKKQQAVDKENVGKIAADDTQPQKEQEACKHVKKLRTGRSRSESGSRKAHSPEARNGAKAEVKCEGVPSRGTEDEASPLPEEEATEAEKAVEENQLQGKSVAECNVQVEPADLENEDEATASDEVLVQMEGPEDAVEKKNHVEEIVAAEDKDCQEKPREARDLQEPQVVENALANGPAVVSEKLEDDGNVNVRDNVQAGFGSGAASGVEKESQQNVDNVAEPDTSLSLGLSASRMAPSNRARSFQSISQAETFSNGITTSLSLSCSHQFAHNPSCSLTQTSHDNQEFSTATQPMCPEGNEQSHGSWQMSIGARGGFSQGDMGGGNSSKRKAGESSVHSQQHFYPKGSLKRHGKAAALPHSAGGLWERWSGSKSMDNTTPYQTVSVDEIVCGSIQVVAQKMEGLPVKAIERLKQTVRELLECTERREEFSRTQKRLEGRTDFSMESLLQCHRTQLEILVALKTGIQAFLLQERPLQSSLLVEVFLHLKCRNIHCQSQLPVDNCECQVCSQKNGFCNACMCVVCSKFDFDANTCRWVGCDYCLHWCHTDCGIRKAYIRPGPSIKGAAGTSEMQSHCIACGHTSELFGFVKEVFTTCAKEWNRETLSRELDCVRRMFYGSEDTRGKQVCWKADLMLQKLEANHDVADVCNDVLKFFEGSDQSKAELAGKRPEAHSSRGAKSYDSDPAAVLERATMALQSYDRVLEEKRTDAAEIQYERARKRAEIEELESIMRIKQAEAKMFQTRADEAAREAEGLQRIVLAKCLKVEEEFNCKKLKLQIEEAEERRKRKFEELQMLQKGSDNFEIMRKLMVDLQGLLRNMDCSKRPRQDEAYGQRYAQPRVA